MKTVLTKLTENFNINNSKLNLLNLILRQVDVFIFIVENTNFVPKLISILISSFLASFIKDKFLMSRKNVVSKSLISFWLWFYFAFKITSFLFSLYFSGVYYQYEIYIFILDFFVALTQKTFFSNFLLLTKFEDYCI
jgi:hypothetical protein